MLRPLITFLCFAIPLACGSSAPPVEQHEDHPHEREQHGHEQRGQDGHKGKHGAEPLGHRFENAEEWAKRFDAPQRDQWQMPAKVIELMQIQSGMVAVDIGAGTGYFLPYLAAKTSESGAVLALDIEADMVRYIENRVIKEKLVNVSARVVATDDPMMEASSVDRILIVDTWHHLPKRVAYAVKLEQALKPGGTLTIVDFTMQTTRGPPKSHRIQAAAILDELKQAGLQAELLAEPLPDQFVIRATKTK